MTTISGKIKKCYNKSGVALQPSEKDITRKVLASGKGDTGQLGLGKNILQTIRFTHVRQLPSDIVDVRAGGMHTVAVDAAGCVFTYGCNDQGALGRNDKITIDWKPKMVNLPGRVKAISAGNSHTATILENGQIYAWGSFSDSHGCMGLTQNGIEKYPVEVLKHHITQIASGAEHLVMLTDRGQVFTCGSGQHGQLGRLSMRRCDRFARNGLKVMVTPMPVFIPNCKTKTEAIWAGSYSTVVRTVSGLIYVWGLNDFRQISSINKDIIFRPVVRNIRGNSFSNISVGKHHSLLVDPSGTCCALGNCDNGRLGLGHDAVNTVIPMAVATLAEHKCLHTACGNASSFAVTNTGTLYAWGMGSLGQLGTGQIEDETLPRLVELKNKGKVITVSVGCQHTVILVKHTIGDEESSPEQHPTIVELEVINNPLNPTNALDSNLSDMEVVHIRVDESNPKDMSISATNHDFTLQKQNSDLKQLDASSCN